MENWGNKDSDDYLLRMESGLAQRNTCVLKKTKNTTTTAHGLNSRKNMEIVFLLLVFLPFVPITQI